MRVHATKLGAISTGRGLGNLLYDVAGQIPSLDLRFADNKSLVDAVTGASLVTFTRASTGTSTDSAGTLQTAATDVPRFDHNPTTGESLGLLVEEARTNLLLRSEELNGADWVTSNCTVSANTTTAPDGAVTAETLTTPTTGNNRELGQVFTSVAGTTYSFSFFVKAGTTSWCYLTFSDRTAHSNGWYFDVTNGVVGGTTGLGVGTNVTRVSSAISRAANGFWRCQVTLTVANAAIYYATVGVVAANNNAGAAAGNTISVWGAQLEVGAFPTSYIPTTTATVTRAADVASITGSAFSSWYRQDEGTLLLNARDSVVFPISLRHYVDLNANSFTSSIGIVQSNSVYTAAGVNIVGGIATGGGAQAAIDLNAQTAGALRVAIAYKTNDVSASRNGVLGTPDTVVSLSSPNRLSIGSAFDSSRICNSAIARITYWPQRLPNSTLQSLTQ
jgi:hypothetical protein